jgi:hypothetical protein
MSEIKTLSEFALERVNKCSDELAKKYLKSVRAIYGSTEHGRPVHIGSSVAIIYKEEKYLITAAHVLDENKLTTLYVSGESHLTLIEATAFVTSAPEGNRDDDIIDFAIIHLNEKLQSDIGDIHYISKSEMLLNDLDGNHRCCLALGYPNSKNKVKPNGGNHIKEASFVYTGYLKSDAELYSKTGTNPKHHYLLDYDRKHSKDEHNNIVNSVGPRGVSGGGLFLIEKIIEPESYRPNVPCSGKLIGILIEFRKNQKVLVYTKLAVIVNVLENNLTH